MELVQSLSDGSYIIIYNYLSEFYSSIVKSDFLSTPILELLFYPHGNRLKWCSHTHTHTHTHTHIHTYTRIYVYSHLKLSLMSPKNDKIMIILAKKKRNAIIVSSHHSLILNRGHENSCRCRLQSLGSMEGIEGHQEDRVKQQNRLKLWS